MSIDPNSKSLLKLNRDWNCYSFAIDGGVSSESESGQVMIIITKLVPWPCILFKDFYYSNTDIYNWR